MWKRCEARQRKEMHAPLADRPLPPTAPLHPPNLRTPTLQVIVFRSCAPIAVCLFDRLFHNRELPGVRSCVALGMIVAGALSYIANDRDFRLSGLYAYRWAIAWWVLLVFNLTLGKFLVSGLQQR